MRQRKGPCRIGHSGQDARCDAGSSVLQKAPAARSAMRWPVQPFNVPHVPCVPSGELRSGYMGHVGYFIDVWLCDTRGALSVGGDSRNPVMAAIQRAPRAPERTAAGHRTGRPRPFNVPYVPYVPRQSRGELAVPSASRWSRWPESARGHLGHLAGHLQSTLRTSEVLSALEALPDWGVSPVMRTTGWRTGQECPDSRGGG